MGTVEELIGKLKELPEFIKQVADNYFNDQEEEILDLNKDQMLIAGVDSEGINLGNYSAITAEIRAKEGLQTEHIDLRFTGDFQDGMDLIPVGPAEVEMTSNDIKWNPGGDVRERFPDAIGLTPISQDILTKELIKTIEFNVDNLL